MKTPALFHLVKAVYPAFLTLGAVFVVLMYRNGGWRQSNGITTGCRVSGTK